MGFASQNRWIAYAYLFLCILATIVRADEEHKAEREISRPFDSITGYDSLSYLGNFIIKNQNVNPQGFTDAERSVVQLLTKDKLAHAKDEFFLAIDDKLRDIEKSSEKIQKANEDTMDLVLDVLLFGFGKAANRLINNLPVKSPMPIYQAAYWLEFSDGGKLVKEGIQAAVKKSAKWAYKRGYSISRPFDHYGTDTIELNNETIAFLRGTRNQFGRMALALQLTITRDYADKSKPRTLSDKELVIFFEATNPDINNHSTYTEKINALIDEFKTNVFQIGTHHVPTWGCGLGSKECIPEYEIYTKAYWIIGGADRKLGLLSSKCQNSHVFGFWYSRSCFRHGEIVWIPQHLQLLAIAKTEEYTRQHVEEYKGND